MNRRLPLCFLVCYVLFTAGAKLVADPSNVAEPLNTTPIMLDALEVKSIKQRLDLYETATKDFWRATMKVRSVSYLDVICVAYAKAEFDLEETLLKKKRYRDRMTARGHDFFCNYAAIQKKIPVQFRNRVGSAPGIERGGPKEWVSYDFKRKAIVVERELYYSSLMHAAGLSLCGSPSPEALERIKKIGAAKKDFEYRRHVNFEIQLQDLNRLYALYAKRPIMNPLDSLEALCMLGEKPKAAAVKAILERNGYRVDPALIEKILANTKERQEVVMYDAPSVGVLVGPANNGPESFLGAHRLMTGLYFDDTVIDPGLRRESGKSYESFLERILLEAPGHI